MNPAKQYETELRKLLEEKKYPEEAVVKGFRHWLTEALRYENCRSLQCDWTTFKYLMREDPEEFNLFQMSFAINAITYRTPKELENTGTPYIEMGDAMDSMAKVWNLLVEPIQETLRRKMQSQQTIKRVK